MPLAFPRFSPTPFVRDLVWTAAASVVTVVCLAGTTELLARGLGAEAFGAYQLMRRLLTSIEPLSTLGMGIALTRYTAVSRNPDDQSHYLVAALCLVVAPTLLILSAGLVGLSYFEQLLFRGREAYEGLFGWTLALIVFYSLYIALYAYYRGTGRMGRANVWQVCTIAVGPLVVAWLFAGPDSVALVVALMAAVLAFAALPLLANVRRGLSRLTRERLVPMGRELLKYGVPRIPGGFAFNGMLAVGPMLAPSFGPLRQVGFLVIGQMIIRMVEGATEAFGRAALPRIAQVYAEHGKPALRDRVEDLLSLILHIGSFCCIHLLIWSRPLVLGWLGPDYAEALTPVRITLLALVPHLAFVTLRAVVDAVEERAVTTWALFVSLTTTTVLSWVLGSAGFGAPGIALGTTVGFYVLGAMVSAYVCRTFHIGWQLLIPGSGAAANIVLGFLSFVFLAGLQESLSVRELLLVGLILEGMLFAGYVAWLRRQGVRWIRQLEDRLRLGRGESEAEERSPVQTDDSRRNT